MDVEISRIHRNNKSLSTLKIQGQLIYYVVLSFCKHPYHPKYPTLEKNYYFPQYFDLRKDAMREFNSIKVNNNYGRYIGQ